MSTVSCHASEREKITLIILIFLILSSLEAAVGMSLNAFTVLVTCVDGIRKGRLKSIDKILAALGISRCFLLFCLVVKDFVTTLASWANDSLLMYQTFRAITWFLTSTSLCFSACLCVFYCVKIANFQHHIFVFLKRRISKLIPWFLLLSIVFSVLNSSPFFSDIYKIDCNTRYNDSLENYTSQSMRLDTNLSNLFFYCSFGFSLAFAVLSISAVLLLFSLWRHFRQMHHSSNNFSKPNMAAHLQAVKTITSILLSEVVYFAALMILLSNIFSDTDFAARMSYMMLFACPSIQSIVLIHGNTTLQQTFIQVICRIRHMLFSAKM